MAITAEAVKELRDRTGLSVMQCKKALEEAKGDLNKALDILSRKSADVARKKGDRALGAGAVASYIHGNHQVGAMVLLSCETDFVSKNEAFISLARDIAMHAAATRPEHIRQSDVSQSALEKLREIFAPEASGKPANIQEKVIDGKVSARLKETVLLLQPFIKDDSKTIQDLIDAASHKFGERIEVSKCAYFSVK
ncbi:MAG: elongation factor Ts [Patescibacteria group bacterium]|nr:elongation factor Ts [Patescibacteria group bacterium]